MTGLVGRLELRTGRLELVNAGHVPPPRAGGAGHHTGACLPTSPFGLFAEAESHPPPSPRSSPATASCWSRTAWSSAAPPAIDTISAIGETADLQRERRSADFADSILRATGHALQDDATVMLLNWHGGRERQRNTTAGAEPARASDPLD